MTPLDTEQQERDSNNNRFDNDAQDQDNTSDDLNAEDYKVGYTGLNASDGAFEVLRVARTSDIEMARNSDDIRQFVADSRVPDRIQDSGNRSK